MKKKNITNADKEMIYESLIAALNMELEPALSNKGPVSVTMQVPFTFIYWLYTASNMALWNPKALTDERKMKKRLSKITFLSLMFQKGEYHDEKNILPSGLLHEFTYLPNFFSNPIPESGGA